MSNYKIDKRVGYCGERCTDADYERQREVLSKFKLVKRYPKDASWCGNIRAVFYNGQCMLEDISMYNPDSLGNSAQKEISSALALYRLLAVAHHPPFANEKYVDFYKLNWEYVFKHKKTGECLVFGEWKGGFQIFTPFYKISDIPSTYKADTEALLEALVSREWPIGYDGTVAGEVA